MDSISDEIERYKKQNPDARVLWTDGSANPNPGCGGYAVIEDGRPVALGREEKSSNIRMEGTALLMALKLLNGSKGAIVTDSEFWINTLTKWAPKWRENGWKKKNGEIKNLTLTRILYGNYCAANAQLIWTQGHVGTEMNELADEWANKARKGATMEDLKEGETRETSDD